MNTTDRLKECTTRIGTMCGDGRPPRMSIPVREDDDDIFITTTCLQAAQEITELRAALQERDAEIGDLPEAQRNMLETIKAQRKALETALEALQLPSLKTQSMLMQRDAAITAIQEVL